MNSIFDNKYARFFAVALLGLLALFFLVKTLGEVKAYGAIGTVPNPQNVIVVSGEGEVFAVPDTATLTYSVIEEGATVKQAQDKATAKSNNVIEFLKEQGIEEEDIKTVNYSFNPKYEFQRAAACREGFCPPSRQVIVGYEVTQSVEVKIKDTEKAGEILTGLGGLAVQNLSGLNFTVDDDDELIREARQAAIADAREEAERIADDLGVRLVRIISFNEQGNYPIPYYKDLAQEGRGSSAPVVNPAPDLPAGQNKFVSNVTISYEIR